MSGMGTDPLLGRRHLQRNWGARVREYAQDGMPLVVLENELLRLAFLAGKGADLVEWLFKPLDLWQAQCAGHVSGQAMPAGHFIPEELPQETADALWSFFR